MQYSRIRTHEQRFRYQFCLLVSRMYKSDSGNGPCLKCSSCPTTHFKLEDCTQFKDTMCIKLTTCGAGEYETKAPTATSDRACAAVRACGAGSQEAVAPTATSDRVCEPCAAGTTDDNSDGSDACVVCGAGTYVPAGSTGQCQLYQCAAGTVDSDASASTPCVACDGQTAFQPNKGQQQCISVSTCAAGQEEQTAPTAVSDRECRPCQLGSTFKASAGQGSTCVAVRTCGAGEEETALPTLSTDRQCATCAAGTFKVAAGQATECIDVQQCAAGYTVSQAAGGLCCACVRACVLLCFSVCVCVCV